MYILCTLFVSFAVFIYYFNCISFASGSRAAPVSEMTYTVSSGTLNSSIPYLSGRKVAIKLIEWLIDWLADWQSQPFTARLRLPYWHHWQLKWHSVEHMPPPRPKQPSSIAQFAITINSNVCPHVRVPNTIMRESYAWRHRNF